MKYRSLSRSLHFVWQRGKWWFSTSVLINIILAGIPITTVWVTKELINTMTVVLQDQSSDYYAAVWLLILQFVLASLSALLRNVEEWIDKAFELRLDHDLSEVLIRKTSSVPLAYFDLPEFYDHYSRINGSMGFRFLSPIKHIMQVGREILSLSSFCVFLFTVHWGLALLSIVAAIPFLIYNSRFGSNQWRLFFRQTPIARDAQYSASLLLNRDSAKEVRSFQLADYLLKRWSSKFLLNSKELLALLRKITFGRSILEMLVSLVFACSALFIIWLSRSTSFLIGDFVAITQAVQSSQGSFNQIASLLAQIYEENFYITDFFDFVDYEVPSLQTQNIGSKVSFPLLQQGISFKNVSYSYPRSAEKVLNDVSFQIRPCEKIAIVGENGSGKTTLVKCLLGLYSAAEGQILFDDVNIENIDEADLKRHMTVIYQDFVRYAYTVQENISMGNIHIADNKKLLFAAAQQSGVDDFVQKYPLGYDTPLGKILADGEDLSGGQWQKIALARALFRESDILILDEPTAALDPLAEMEVFRQFGHITRDKTAIFISHRMSAARMADRIFVMKEGRLVEEGSHDKLISLKGEYARMFEMQASWFKDEVIEWK